MKIYDIRAAADDASARLSACIEWEDTKSASREYFFEVPRRHESRLGNGADAFFCAALVPALRNGERRIWIEDPVCPVLLENAREALFWISAWNREKYRDRRVDLDCRCREQAAPPEPGSALFLSGGVDANYAMHQNHLAYPAAHPARARYGVVIYGFDIGGRRSDYGSPASLQAFERTLSAIGRASDNYALELIPVRTNVRHLDDASGFWGHEFVGAALSSVAHALGSAAGLFYLSSAGEPVSLDGNVAHFGTHPLLDPCYSGYGVRIRHYLVSHDSRISRLRCLADIPQIIDNIRVCYNSPADSLNCGRCEKCVRTKLMLDVFGRLEGCKAFVDARILPEELDNISIDSESVASMYRELLTMSEGNGYLHTQRIRRILKRYAEYKKWKNEMTWKGRVKRFDRRHLNGIVARLFDSGRRSGGDR